MTKRLTIIDQQYESGNALIAYLKTQQELTLWVEAENNFSKNILLSIASYFENEITEIMIEFAKTRSNNDELIVSLIKTKAIKRQYHTYFDWDKGTNANSFFSLFGDNFKIEMYKRVKENQTLELSVKAFLELGQERNKLVHQNFAEIVLDKTAEEIYTLYKRAILFIDTIRQELILKIEEDIQPPIINGQLSKQSLCNRLSPHLKRFLETCKSFLKRFHR
jgi:hypothetical protein